MKNENKNSIELNINNSSCISKIKYNKDNKTLTIVFTSGETYDYMGIEEPIIEEWINNSIYNQNFSHGKFFNKNIKKKEYKYEHCNHFKYV